MATFKRVWFFFRCLSCPWTGERGKAARKCPSCGGRIEKTGRAKALIANIEVNGGGEELAKVLGDLLKGE